MRLHPVNFPGFMNRLECMQLRAPAKINLSFRIRHRRSDGFHEIETLMSPVSLYDEITLQPNESGLRFHCDNSALLTDNLVVRAAELFFEKKKTKPTVDIALKKNIPYGAGLGGGSSDAATTLLGLNELFEAGFSREELSELAAQIGSDVPFFIYQSAATCGGRGEIVTPTKLKAPLSLLLLKPEFSVSTPWAYSHWMDSRELPDVSYASQEFDAAQFVNDLERPVLEKFVFLAEMKRWLRQQPEVGAALLSGSGSTVFAVLKDGADVKKLAKRARAELDPDLWTCACATL
jgi:4-diphosphocytidyl-2-C-methyl-D-erythritol kinase